MYRVLLMLASEDLEIDLQRRLGCDYEIMVSRCCGDLNLSSWDALILDLFLPGVDGITLLGNMGQHRPPVIIALTNLVNADILQALDDIGVSVVVRKPCNIKFLVELLRKHVQTLGNV